MDKEQIAAKIAYIKCEHTGAGFPGRASCVKKIEKSIVDVKAVIAVARYLEHDTKLERITPLTWCQAYDLVKLVLGGDSDSLSR